MKLKIITTVILFLFSYLYLQNTASFIRQKDKLMQEIIEKQNLYFQNSQDAIITSNIMIPGKIGQKVNLNKSYQKMKSINVFNESLLIFDKIYPKKSIHNHYDKIIIGNPNKKAISLLLDGDTSNIDDFIKENNIETNPNYCITNNLKIKNNCAKEKKYTILVYPIHNYYLSNTKKIIKDGIIILYKYNSTNYNELLLTIKYLKNNGYQILKIDDLIKE